MEIKKEEAYSRVFFQTLNFLSFSRRSAKEILEKVKKYTSKTRLSLSEKNEVEDMVIQRLKSDGYLRISNDEDYANFYIEGLKKSGKPFNSIRISNFLQKKGISREIINDLVKNLDKDSIYESVLRDAEKKLKVIRDPNRFSKKKKLLNYLYRKGYPFDIISSVVDTLL